MSGAGRSRFIVSALELSFVETSPRSFPTIQRSVARNTHRQKQSGAPHKTSLLRCGEDHPVGGWSASNDTSRITAKRSLLRDLRCATEHGP